MLPAVAETLIQQIIKAISSGDFTTALAQTCASRCSAADLARVITEYGRAFVAPPFSRWIVIPISSTGNEKRWSVRAPLWSESEGGRSDLELHLTVAMVGDTPAVELDDLLVP